MSVDKDLKRKKIGQNEEVVLISNDTKDNLNAKSVERVIDTGAGYLIKSNSETKEKARPRRFFECWGFILIVTFFLLPKLFVY